MIEITKIEDKELKEKIAREVLENLPEWFGLQESTEKYIQDVKALPFWTAVDGNQYIGFIACNETSPATVEINCMGVLKLYHRMGIGKLLFNSLLDYAKENEYDLLQVKTVDQGHYKEYDQTIAFYENLGFKKLEVFPALWNVWNPCLIMVMIVS